MDKEETAAAAAVASAQGSHRLMRAERQTVVSLELVCVALLSMIVE